MRTYCKRLDITRELVASAYESWRRGQSGRKNHYRVAQEYGTPGALIDEITSEIAGRRLVFRPIRRYSHHERTNGKTRTIGVESVKQQVCDHLCVMCIQGMLDDKMGYYQCAGVKHKGQRLCRTALGRWSREGGYFVKADIRQCYPSLKTHVVMRVLRKYVRSADVLYLAETLMATYDGGGMEIGSHLSLCLVNLILSFAYHHVEGLGKHRRGKWKPLVTHQLWHLDDVLLFSKSKRDLKVAMRTLERYLAEEFGLHVKPWKVCRMGEEAPDMGGWVARDGVIRLREGTFIRARRAFRRFDAHRTYTRAKAVVAYWGWFKHADLERFVRSHSWHRKQRIASTLIGRWESDTRRCIAGA